MVSLQGILKNVWQASPRVLVQIATTGARILGKAFYEAGRQAVKNAKHRPEGGLAGDAAGVSNATSGSITDKLTREHRMTLDEAQLILNLKRTDPLEVASKHYEHLFKANSPPPPPEKGSAATSSRLKSKSQPVYSHYLQSKVVRALERIQAEAKLAQQIEAEAAGAAKVEGGVANGAGSTTSSSQGPPPPSS
ncbi:hypothetical protein PUNSTDRAFT_61904 [Punctularia strigosozonata HHB-11173 SS5]|uniref:uncharacterized protein n=1 Tax=Punctularia strigosozonata (strain HHB-11173) TaxID=741275 RepID=UPI0004418734|nr:uncharacterized protein PUNSTDRAFT_61904 [Punctularia strigosozonata HHB-11173 SS5]EIN11628.1 hypothetical protein PUNSTDRAFT_61904 [Punctularia strigosozonata HHB-11173 SS5]